MTFPAFPDPAVQDAARFGGKSARLAALAAGGFPIPAGFAIPVDALLDWQAVILPGIEAAIAGLDRADERNASAGIARLFQSTPLGPDLRHRIAASCRAHLPGGLDAPVAVRSSAVGEDAAEASFAGQFESLLGVRRLDGIDRALRAVWASLYSPRAIRYRREAGLPAAASPMGVAVLEMVDAVASGVAFSVDVVTGKRDRIIIEATHGLAEPLVQGRITPDRLVVDKAEARVMTVAIGGKDLLCRMGGRGGTVTAATPPDLRAAPCLTPAQASELGETVARLEGVSGHPVDVEWVIGPDGRLRLVQARPVSSPLPPAPVIAWDRAAGLSRP